MGSKIWKVVNRYSKKWFINGMSAMALGLFASLIIGLILTQISKIPGLSFLAEITKVIGAASPVVGSAMGVAIAYALKASPLVIFSCCACGACGYAAGGPVGAYVAAIAGTEIGMLISKKTKLDIILTPMVTIVAGGGLGLLTGPALSSFMSFLGGVINDATVLAPIPMGIIIAVLVGLALTAPISSAALCIMIGISGIAAGAATVGCCAQMVGFAVMSYQSNKIGASLSIGLGTSMLQFANILRRPAIWIPPTLSAAILGPIATTVLKMTNTPEGAGMGTSGLVGQFGTFASMSPTTDWWIILIEIAVMQVILPALLTFGFYILFKKLKWFTDEDLILNRMD
ncbi:MAG: PTS sugar transporter subunit IIC [Clostridia bacterium]